MSIKGFVFGRWRQLVSIFQHRRVLAGARVEQLESNLADWPNSLQDPTGFYLDAHRYFHLLLPPSLREHRNYFRQNSRGFGEDAFHVLWFLLFRRFKPVSFLEIGVYRGQTLSLALMLQDQFEIAGEIAGISPFNPAGDSVSRYRTDIDYEQDTRVNCAQFTRRIPTLLHAYSTDESAKSLIASRAWDCCYVDGNHDYEIARADWNLCAANVKTGGIIVLDDSGLGTSFTPPAFASKGHPGPSRVAEEIDRTAFDEVLRVGHNRVFQKR
jgi:hypothetical protein